MIIWYKLKHSHTVINLCDVILIDVADPDQKLSSITSQSYKIRVFPRHSPMTSFECNFTTKEERDAAYIDLVNYIGLHSKRDKDASKILT